MRPLIVHWLERFMRPDLASFLAPSWFMCVGLAGLVGLVLMIVLGRRRGIDAALVHRAAVVSHARGYTWCEVGWTLEDNDLINGLIEAVNGDRYKTYRIYERSL